MYVFPDLLRCESLHTLDDATATRILQRNYRLACVCVCVCVCVYVCVCTCACVCVFLCMYVHNYSFSTSVLVSMTPLSQEIRSVTSCCPPHLGPPIPEVNSIWFKLWLYTRVRCGPPSILLTKGTRVKKFPPILKVMCSHAYVRILNI